MEFGSPPSTASTVEVQYAHKYPVLVRDPATGDFTTFVVTITVRVGCRHRCVHAGASLTHHCCTMQMAQAITLVMQFGSDDDVRVFAAASTSAEDKTAVLAKCMAASVDNPVFITMPPAPVFIPPMRSVILLALDQPTQLMALCHVVSAPLQQTGDFILRHASLPESDYSHVMQVVPRIVFKSPTLLADTLAGPPASPQVQTMDAHYGLNDITRSIIRMCVPELMEWYHPMLDNAMVSCLAKGTRMRLF